MKKNTKTEVKTAATLDDVAKLAGVSTATVSRALNRPDSVAQKTINKVKDAVAVTGYVANLLAGGLASKRSRLVAAITPSMENIVHAETIKYFSRFLRGHGYQVLLGESEYRTDIEDELVAAVLARRPDAILLTGSSHTKNCRRMLLAADIPIVEVWDLNSAPLDMKIGFSYEQCGRAVADYLLAKGYPQIATLYVDDSRTMTRVDAFRAQIAQKTGRPPYEVRLAAPSDFAMGRSGLLQLFESGFKQGAVFCSSDNLALGVLMEAASQNISIPDQLAVIGFGDQHYAAATHPPLTTVRFDRQLIGQRAGEVILKRLSGDDVGEVVMDIGFSIVERETC